MARPTATVTGARDRQLRWLALALAVAAAGAGSAYALLGGAAPDALIGPNVVAASFVITGFAAWASRPANPTGRLMLALGIWLLLTAFAAPPWLLVYPLGLLAFIAANLLLIHLILAFPSGRLETTAQRGLLLLAFVAVGLPRIVRLLTIDPAAQGSNLVNPWLVIREPAVADVFARLPYYGDVIVLVAMLTAVATRWLGASPPARRILAPVLGPALVLLVVLLIDALAIIAGSPASVRNVLDTAQLAVRTLIPIGFLAGILRTRMARSAISELVVELGQTPAPARLRDALANALGDPSLAVTWWSSSAQAFVDADGSPVAAGPPAAGRAVTVLERAGTPLAAITHDAALLDDPGLVASVASAMRLAVENERLQQEVEAQLDEVRASRARIVAAGDAERRRVERDLHDGAQQRLVSLVLALRLARARLGDDPDPATAASLEQASVEAKAALDELRELARGIHPQILTEAGLAAALESLAARSAVDVTVEADAQRYPAAVEGAAYFVVSEALANVAKYAQARHATVRVGTANGALVIEIADDGIGGADPAAGTGLRGLADRLAAVEGTLEVRSPRGGGTRVLASIPVPVPAGIPG